ncbi:MAG: antitoxin MazE-like protein [Roseiarcus sp.]
MPRAKRESKNGLTKFQRDRRIQESRGMKLLRIWVPDPNRPEFAKEAERQAKLLRGRAEEKEALDFIESAFEWPEP